MRKKQDLPKKLPIRQDWIDKIDDEIDVLMSDVDNLELSEETTLAIENLANDLKKRIANVVENDLEITSEIAFKEADLFYEMLDDCEYGYNKQYVNFDSDHLDKMVSILENERGGTFVRADSIPEQMKLEAFIQELEENPYQLKLIA